MSRSNRKNGVRRRSQFTGEPHQLAFDETAKLVRGEPLIPDAQTAAQRWVESAIMHRLLHGMRASWQAGSRPGLPLSVKAACPSLRGLRLVVPLGDVPTFGAALAMRGDADVARPPSDEVLIRCTAGGALRLTGRSPSSPEGAVTLQCSWKDLRASVATDPYVSAPSSLALILRANGIAELPDDGRAVLSGLLRRIALFTEPVALDWLFAWHDWLVRDRPGERPSPPGRLTSELSDEAYGLLPAQLRTLGIGRPPLRPRVVAVPRLGTRVRPAGAHEVLGRRLRSLRQSGGITLTAAAGSIHGSTSKIARMELGRTRIKESDLERLLTLYGVPEDEERLILRELNVRLNEASWWQHFGHVLDDRSSSCFVLESIAEFIWEYDIRLVPSLLQTRAYAEAVIRLRCTDEDRIRGLVEMHVRRQRQALEPGAPRIWAVLDFSAIADGIGDPGVMREQIRFLLQAAELPHVAIQVLPPQAGGQAVTSSSFALLRLRGAGLPDVVHLHLSDSHLLLNRSADPEPYRRAMYDISVAAATPGTTREILNEGLRRIEAR